MLLLLAIGLVLAMWLAPSPFWGNDFHGGRCLGPCCLITQDFIEVSCFEYRRP